MAVVILKLSDGYKKIVVQKSEDWILKMMENPTFLFGYIDDGSFAALHYSDLNQADLDYLNHG